MLKTLKQIKYAHKQTLFFILMMVIYMGAIFWTTFQSYARLQYSRSDGTESPITIETKQDAQTE